MWFSNKIFVLGERLSAVIAFGEENYSMCFNTIQMDSDERIECCQKEILMTS